jgi:hypothetical protein
MFGSKNIFRREAHLFGKVLYARRQISILRAGVGLALLIKGHHHHCSTVATQQLRVMDKGLNPSFIEMELTIPLP